MERLVAVDQRLDEVVAGRDVLQAPRRPADGRVVDDDVWPGFMPSTSTPKIGLVRVRAVLVTLRLRLRLAIVGDEQEDAAVERLGAAGRGKGNGKAERRRGVCAHRKRGRPRDREGQRGRT